MMMRQPPHEKFDQVENAPATAPSADYSQTLVGYRFEGVVYAPNKEAAQSRLDGAAMTLDRARIVGQVHEPADPVAGRPAWEIQVEFDQLAFSANMAGASQEWLDRMGALASRVRAISVPKDQTEGTPGDGQRGVVRRYQQTGDDS
jgi:hypothetical protein